MDVNGTLILFRHTLILYDLEKGIYFYTGFSCEVKFTLSLTMETFPDSRSSDVLKDPAQVELSKQTVKYMHTHTRWSKLKSKARHTET